MKCWTTTPSFSVKDEKAYLQQCWRECVEQNTIVPIYIIHVDQLDDRVKKVHTSFLSTTGHDLSQDREASENSSTCSSFHSTTSSQLQGKEELSQPAEIIVETTENVIDMQLAPEEAFELTDSQGTKTTSDTSTSFLGQVPITRTTDETKWGKNHVPQSSLCKALAIVSGPSEEVSELHRRLKATTHCRTAIYDEKKYMQKLAHFQKIVLAESSATKQALQKWEKS
ncbi:Hypothetical predicted protein [Paramuricea clavata]|uniref:Uncharacterized protein n=1 Tax=Paramuricea clavata TaxID=317549 RepID=A0A6S7GT00_PARCT|nr:Hypothetical predicted protein [Paramuricea clavata]